MISDEFDCACVINKRKETQEKSVLRITQEYLSMVMKAVDVRQTEYGQY